MIGDPHSALRDDVRLLGELLGDILRRHEGAAFFDRVEEVRALAKTAHEGDPTAFDRLAVLLRKLPIAAAVPIARAFAHFLMLANIAEQHHRIRRRREYARDAHGRPQPGSCEEVFPRLIAGGIRPTDLASAVAALRIELVLTAHPTEILRRTLIQAQRRIAETLASRDRRDLTAVERDATLDSLRRDIDIVWQTDDARDRAVSPLDEVRGGLLVFEQTLWDGLPQSLRSLDRALQATTGRALPLDAAPLRFGSWIGGDRDGNPRVTPEVTRQATWLARWMAADLYLRDVEALRTELSLSRTSATDELRARVPDAAEPYRAVLRQVSARLIATRAFAEAQLEPTASRHAGDRDPRPYLALADFVEPLALCHRSLMTTGNALIAAGRLTDVLRRTAAFGLTLARLDLRQESSRHAEAVEWVAQTRGLGAYASASEEVRTALLVRALTNGVPPITDDELVDAPEPVRDVVATCRTAAALHADSLGAYVVTMTHAASDVLAVELLQRLAAIHEPLRVVPLFETVADLDRSPEVVDTLLGTAWYRGRILDFASSQSTGGRIEVMVGYSDSAKDAGRLAAAWALHRAQEEIVATCRRHQVAVTLFHGRGGSIGRGGGPTYLAIQSQPPGSVDGTLRVTEQGEMIQAKFGLPEIATRSLEVYTTAVIEAMLRPAPTPSPLWRAAMDRLFDDGRAAYRAVVHDRPQFAEYFRRATPEPELRAIHLGSRPARRGSGEDVESLRAIPWQFAWTQTRLMLASWLGVESAIEAAQKRGEDGTLRSMYAHWPFFRSTIDLMEMVLAKADARIAAEYDRRLVPRDLQPLGDELRSRLTRAAAAVLAVSGHQVLVESSPVLRRSIDTRNPYVDPINLVQIELLERLRAAPDAAELRHAFVVTVNGIAAGMRNTG